MWLKTVSGGLVLLLGLAACTGSAPVAAEAERGGGAETPQDAVADLVKHLTAPDFAAASDLVVPTQAAVASLVEGATFSQVADAVESGDAAVASNFWAGFAQGAGGFLAGSVTTSNGPVVSESGLKFHTVEVTLDDGNSRQMLTRDVDGFRVDLFASFGGGLADKMIPPVERLINSQTDDAAVIIPALQAIVPSLLVAANQPNMTPKSVQDILRLVELITRVS